LADAFPSRFAGPGESPGFLLWQVANRWQRRVREALAEEEFTHVQFVLLASLAWLARAGASATQAELARHAGTDVMMTSQVVRALEARGLLERARHPDDARARALTLTNAGRERVVRALPRVEAADLEFFAAAGDGGAAILPHLRALLAADEGRG
jgi:DNA-binding MarR family transcriptional regulator